MRRLSYSSRKIAIAVTLAVAAVALMIIYGAQARPNSVAATSGKAVLIATRDIPLGTSSVRDHRRTMGRQGARAGRRPRSGCGDQHRAARESGGLAADLPRRTDYCPEVR